MEDLSIQTTAELVERIRVEARYNHYDEALIGELGKRYGYHRCPKEDGALIRELDATVLIPHFGRTRLPPQTIHVPGAKHPPAPAYYRRQDEAGLARLRAERLPLQNTPPPSARNVPTLALPDVSIVRESKQHDLFISYASEDLPSFVAALADALRQKGLTVWHDRSCVALGDLIPKTIDTALRNSRFAVVVLSRHYFEKRWTEAECSAILAHDAHGEIVTLPIWHGVSQAAVSAFSPILAAKRAIQSSEGLDIVVAEIFDRVRFV